MHTGRSSLSTHGSSTCVGITVHVRSESASRSRRNTHSAVVLCLTSVIAACGTVGGDGPGDASDAAIDVAIATDARDAAATYSVNQVDVATDAGEARAGCCATEAGSLRRRCHRRPPASTSDVIRWTDAATPAISIRTAAPNGSSIRSARNVAGGGLSKQQPGRRRRTHGQSERGR